MNNSHYQSRLSTLSARFNLMVFQVFGLLIANVILSGLVYHLWQDHSVEIIPFSGGTGYTKSAVEVDSHYLSLMSENFIYSRLNVTPETVDANHQRLLRFADSKNYSEILTLLNHEATIIHSNKISSVFEITEIQTNPHLLTSRITGVLKRYVGLRAIKEERMRYQLRFRYAQGRLTLLAFSNQ